MWMSSKIIKEQKILKSVSLRGKSMGRNETFPQLSTYKLWEDL